MKIGHLEKKDRMASELVSSQGHSHSTHHFQPLSPLAYTSLGPTTVTFIYDCHLMPVTPKIHEVLSFFKTCFHFYLGTMVYDIANSNVSDVHWSVLNSKATKMSAPLFRVSRSSPSLNPTSLAKFAPQANSQGLLPLGTFPFLIMFLYVPHLREIILHSPFSPSDPLHYIF